MFCKAETTKESIKTKVEIVSVSMLSNVLSIDKLLCPQIWNIEQEKEKKKKWVAGQRSSTRKRATAI